MEIITGLAVEVIKYTFGPVKRQVCYFFDHESKVQSLNGQLEKLKDAKDAVQESVDAALRNGELISPDVDKWLTGVNKKTTEGLEELKADEDKAKGKCFIGLCPNFLSRYHLSKKAEAEADAVAELLSEGDKLMNKTISYLPDPQQIVSTFDTGFEAFESRRQILEGITEALKDPNVQRIGVYGMSGLGKTMLAKAVAKKARDENLFDEVVFATISNSKMTDIIHIQAQIAEECGMKLEEVTEFVRATRLRQRLKNGRRILIILDDIWKEIDLEAVGISFQEDQNVAADEMTSETFMQNSKVAAAARYKLLLTSRSQDTLCNQMSTEKNFRVGTILEEDAMTLFTRIVGNKVEENGYKYIAIDVVKKCAGLPIAISVIANALKNMDLDVWKDALQKLNRSNPTDIDGMEDKVYAAVELSYKYLRSKEAQEIFLLCSLWPQGSDISVSDLIKYSWGLDFLERVRTLNEARKRVHASVHKLKGCGLLLGNDTIGLVKLHDIVHAVSISIGLKDKQMFVVDDEDHMDELHEKGKLKTCSAISMPYSDIHKLPSVLECPQLKFLSILSKDPFLKFSDAFFKETNQLKVLNLTGMNFSSLPSSFSSLEHLRMLSLHQCKLGDIAIIGQLKKLEILSFLQSHIEQLPLELGQLSKLKFLDLSNCSRLKVIPKDLISSLCGLEELLMGNSFDGWGVEGNARLVELNHLPLIALEISIPDAQMMRGNLFSEKLERFKIHVGDVWNERYINDKTYTTLKLKLNTNMYLDHGIQMLLKKSEDIYLDEVKGVKNVISKFAGTGISQLKNLYIENCSELQHVTDSRQGISYVVFPTLESLSLLNLFNLENIHGGRLEAGSFNTLKVIKVNSCRKMRNLVSSPMARELHQLQEIEVSECENIIEIVENKEEDTNDKLEFCSLRILKVTDIPKLITFCCERPKNSKSPQEYIGGEIELRLQSNRLFNIKDELPGLEELELRSINIQRIWDSAASFPSPNLTRLVIDCCSNLRNLFSSPMARSLQQLKRLEVRVCQSITQIVSTDYEMTDDEISFPNLEFLSLEQLPKLTRFCGHLIKLSSLRELSIKCCPVLMSFVYNIVTGETSSHGKTERKESNENLHSNMSPLFDERVSLPKLERLEISKMGSLRRIWGDQLDLESFNNLNDFKVWECNGLLNIFPITMLGRLQRLSRLHIYGCSSLEEIFKCEQPNLSHGKQPTPKLEISRVTHFYLIQLPKLKSFFGEIIECPSLSIMSVCSCSGVELLFASDYLSFQKAQEEEEEKQQPLFWVNEITFHNLQELTLLRNENLKEIWSAQAKHSSQCFPNLKFLRHDFSTVDHHIRRGRLLNCFLSFPCLKRLEVGGSSFQEMFQGEVQVGETEFDLPNTQLSELKLLYLNELRYLWNDKFESLQPLFQELTTLQVDFCRKLKSLVPSSKSFPNLVTLDISRCNGLINLLTHSIAKSFVHLTKMRVIDCERIKGIIAEDEAMDVIVFTQLKNLELNNLPSLQNFCLSTAPIEFPSLDELIMTGCPHLKIFCQGTVITPKLKKVQLIKEKDEEKHQVMDGDVNNTIKQLYQDKVGFVGLKNLDFSKFPELIKAWSCCFPRTDLGFQNLRKMKLCNCKSNSLRYLLTSSMVLCLVNLGVMEIENCNMIEQVMADAGANEAKTYKIILPQLRSISLKSCSNLTSFCLGSYAFACPILHSLDIANCPKMFIFSKEQVDDDISQSCRLDKGMIEAFFSNKVVLPKLERLELTKMERLRRIWGDQLALESFNDLNYFRACECNGLLNIFSTTLLRRLQRLSMLSIRSCNSVEEIFECEAPNLSHGKQTATKLEISSLTSISFYQLPKLKRFFGKAIECPSLRTVEVNSCSKVELLFASDYLSIEKAPDDEEEEIHQPLCWVNETTFPNLEELSLLRNKNLKEIWHAQGQLSSQCFPNLKVLNHDFSGMDHHIERDPLINCLWSFPSLKKLEVRFSSFKEIFQGEVQVGETELNLPNPQLGQLKLHGLNKLRCLWNENSEPLAAIFQELITLEVSSCRKLKNLVPSSKSFPNLVTLDISSCDGLINLMTHSVAESFVHLTRMRVADCERIEGIIAEDEAKDVIVFTQLKNLELNNLPSLQNFCLSTAPIEFPSLGELIMTGCPQLKIFCQGALSTPKLQKVQLIKTCDDNRHRVIDCDLNNTIRQLYQEKVGFMGLKNLDFSKFPELIEIWNNSFPQTILGFQNLGKMRLCNWKSNSLRYMLTPSMALCLVSLGVMEIENCNMVEQVMADTCANVARTHKVLLPQLRSISLKSCSNLTSFYLGSCAFEFPVSRKLDIANCPKMATFFAEQGDEEISGHYVLGKGMTKTFFSNKVALPELERLKLTKMESLRRIWGDQLALESFNDLNYFSVCECNGLLNMFPGTMLRRLQRLSTLSIRSCNSVEEIFECEEPNMSHGKQTAAKIEISSLSSISFYQLPKLKRFFGKAIECPSLRTVEVNSCSEVELLFASDYLSIQKAQDDEEEEIHQPLFWVNETTFPNLEEFSLLRNKNLKEIWRAQGQLSSQCFPNLKVLNHDFSGMDHHIERNPLINCLWSFPCLKRLEVRFSSFKEIFQGEVQVGETELNLPNPQLGQLKLHGLNKLECLWNENSEPLAAIFQELITLEVSSCRKLRNLVPSSKSFPNLVTLDISFCDGLINLMTHSVAESFVHLTSMRVADCEKIEGIIAEDEAKDVIVFTQLKNLELNNLPSLQNFCLSTGPVEFPSLGELIMTGCPQLKIFCQGALSTPKLQKVQLIKTYDEDRRRLIDCDLNNTIRQLYQEKVGFVGLKNLDFSKFPELIEIWNSSFSQTILGFQNLGKMKLCNWTSNSLRYMLTPSMALCLVSLGVMEIENCNMIEQVMVDAGANEAKTHKILLPQLRSISLKSCSNLTSFYLGSYAFEFPVSHKLEIADCPKMVTFFAEQVDEEISEHYMLGKGMTKTFFSNKVALPELERLELTKMESLRRIWGDQLALESFNDLNYFSVCECNGLLNMFPGTMLRRLQRLSTLSIRSCNSVEEIFECEEPNMSHGKQTAAKIEISSLSSISFYQLPKLKRFFGKAIECPSLRTVEVNSCSEVELLFASDYLSIQKAQDDEEEEIHQPLFWVNETTFPNLEEFSLLRNKNLKEIWRAQGQLSSQCFPNLKVLNHDFSGMDHHIERNPLINCLWSFPCLKRLEVRFSSFKEIFQGEVQVGETELNLPNPQLGQLKLHGLNKLECLWNENSEPLAAIFQELITLEVSSCRKLRNLVPSSKSFPNLVTLDISFCDGLINLMTHSVAESFVHLTSMRVADCEKIEGIIAEDEAKDVIVFTQLKNLELNNLPSLQNFCLSTGPVEFPSLGELIMTGCPQLKIFCQGALSTPKLQKVQLIKTYDEDRHRLIDCDLNNTIKQLYQEKVGFVGLKNLDFSKFPELIEIWNSSFSQTILGFQNLGKMKLCNWTSNSLRYMLTPSMALCLVSLGVMEIENCNMIEQVMVDAGANEAKTHKILLPQLRSISLKSCSNLTSFYLGSYAFEFPVSHKLEIADCPKMVTFFAEQVDEEISEHYMLGKGMTKTFFSNKVSFPRLGVLKLSLLNNMKSIWDNQIPIDSFGELKTLEVKFCEKLLSIFSPNTFETFQGLEEITIEDCHSLEVLVELQGININKIHAMKDTNLKELHLIRLPKMKHLWGKDFQGILSLENLRFIHALRCWNLKYMFPTSVAKAGLAQLEKVVISSCGIEEFFGNGRGQEEVGWFEFPKLTKVKLFKLPRLKSLYPGGKGTLFCPELETLEAFHCSKLKIFGTNQLYDVEEKNVEDQLELQYQQKPHFSIEEVIFKLKELSLINDDIAMINGQQFPTSENFHEITTLHILCYHDGSVPFPFCFLERFPNLEKLVVRCGKFKQLFPCEGDINEENRVGTVLSRIRHLQLSMLGDLRHIQNQNGHYLILKNLETLQVWSCNTLLSLASSLASFPNLMKLDVWNCAKMENILAISTCQCLVGLKEMRIRECYMVTEVVAKHGDEETREITFSKLDLLVLDCLPNLTSFCSGNYSFNFPSLEKVIVKRCPGFKIFSQRFLSTPELESVDDGDEGHWAGDLMSTIQQLYTEKVGYRGLQYMDFSQFPELADLWINLNPHETLDFKNLNSLEICNYNSLPYLFTPSMTLGLVKLSSLKVKNCASIEHVFTEEGFDGSELVKDVILLPLLYSVSLESCPNLTSFYLLGRDALECLSLNKIAVIDCPKMITFASPLLSERKKDTTHEASKERPLFGKEVDRALIESFFTDKVVLPSLIHLKLSSVNIPKIWEDGKHSIMSSCVQAQLLTVLTVKSCGNLTYLFPSSMVKSCAQLETLAIQDCKLMTGVILDDIQRSQHHSEPSSSENHFEFPWLREFVIENCPSLETFITNTLNGADETVTNALPLLDEKVSFPSLERLKLQSIGAKVVWHGQHQHPVAKSLVQLVITDCGMIREVMTCAPTDVIRDGIVFNRLKHLELGCLPDLENFCSAERTLEFPSLEEVFVKVCPNMKTFSRGETSTPNLQSLQLKEGEDEELCEGGLNKTVQKFFAKSGHL